MDVTALRQSDANLRASEGRYRELAANLPNAAVFVVGPDLRYQLAAGKALTDAGFSPAAMEGRSLARRSARHWPPSTSRTTAGRWPGESFEREHAAHGRHFVTHGHPMRGGGAVAAVLAVSYDITDRVRTEEELRASEERFRLLVENARDHAIFAKTPDGRVASWNAGAERVFGYPPDEIVGRSAGVFFTPEDRAAGLFEREVATAAATGRAGDENWAVRRDGSRFWGERGVLRHPRRRRHPHRVVKVVRDRTDQRAAEEAVRRAEEQLRLALAPPAWASGGGRWSPTCTRGTPA